MNAHHGRWEFHTLRGIIKASTKTCLMLYKYGEKHKTSMRQTSSSDFNPVILI